MIVGVVGDMTVGVAGNKKKLSKISRSSPITNDSV